jgi:hypothetical protein
MNFRIAHQLAKVLCVLRDHYAVFREAPVQYSMIWLSTSADVERVHRIMFTCSVESDRELRGQTLVDKKTSSSVRPRATARAPNQWMSLCIGDGGFDRFPRQVWIIAKNVVNALAMLDPAQHSIDRHPGALNYGRSPFDGFIDDNRCIARD